ncbi:titin-like isoform X7 [Zophobas morio]|uniref:titin-like isoform X7 n=1 Tax=Zophobas morio TaxID=2755281 RepID=UPI003083569E
MVTENGQTDGNTSFLRAARNGQLEKVLEHLESNIDINTSNANGLNALHLASKDGHVEIVEELLKRGAVIDAATKKGNTALHIASLAGQEEVVKLLVTHGASVNVQSQNGFTPLYMAAQENHDNVVRYLLANGANQSLSTEDGFTPLAVAMQQGHDKVVTVLLENDTKGKVRLPALHIAAKKDDIKAAKLLLENEHNPDVTSKSGFTPLHIASHYGNQSIANLLVQKGADVNYAAKHNITPLHVAAKWGKTNMVTVLLEQGANIESKTRDGLTPLHCAARSGHEQVVDMLLEKGAPISSKTKNGLAPLHMAAQGDHVDAARILLYHRAPVDEVTVDYLTALHVAAHCGHVRVAKLLLDRQADANARALNGFTPLHIACKKNRIKVVELLIKHRANIGATTESGLTPLHVASFMGCMNIVIYLLQHEADPDVPTVRGETPLHLAARANQTDIIRILLRNGAQVDARAREQQTPLHIASRLGNVDIVMLLLQHGAQVDNTTKDMYTALHIAAKEGQDEVAAALIDNGASLNATTKKGFTPLHLAAKYGHLKVAKLLLQKEAPVDAQGKNGVTPLHVASHYDHQNVALLLLEKGASPYATAKNGHTPLHIAAKKNQMDIANTLLEYGAKPNAESKAGFTPLHLSAQEGHCDMTDLLIEHQADTNHRARNGLSPLHLCAQEDKVSVAEILVKNGGEVDAATKNGYTPLHIACHYGQINMVRFLLANGANVKATTSLGYTPLHQAAQQGHTNIVNTLLENSAVPNAVTNNGQTPLHIAEKLGYITVIDTLKVVTQPSSPTSASPISNDEKYRVVAPEAMHETFMSDSEEEGGEDTVLGDQTYRYLTADEMKSLGDDSLPIDVTRDERIDSNKIIANAENMLPPRHIEDNISPEHVQQNYVEYIKKYTPDNVDIDKHPISIGKLHWKNFLVSFLVDARGGAMRGCRHSGVRVIVPPRCASSPTRITCRYVRPQRTPHPPPLMEGEALASRVLELGPVGAKFLGPVIIEVPHFAALRGKEREIVILRSDNGESWKEHTVEATEEVLNEVLHDSFEAEDLNQLEDISSGRITRIVTQDFPQYFAVVSRIRQEVHAIGPEGGMVSSTVVPQVQAVFPQGALTKKIKVGLQAQPIDPELTAKLLGHGVAVSPVVTVEPRRRKFHKAITLSMPAPRAHSQGMINQYSGNAPTLRLLCSITGGTTRAQWEDVTGSTPLTFVNDCVSFTTTVSARFWLMDCRNVGDATKMATELYREAIHVPFMAKFVVFAKRVDPLEARLRVFCMTDDKEDKTLEHQEHFTEVAKSRDVEVLEGKPQYIEFAGNLVPITKSGEQLQFSFRAFRENRLPFSVRVKDQHAEAVSRCLFMREPKLPKGEPPQQPICILNIVLPDDIVVDTISLTDSDSVKKIENFDYYRPDPRLADMSNLLGDDWVPLAAQLGLTTSEINVIKSEYPDSVAKQAQSMLRMWLSQSGNKAQTNTLESALRRIGREDIIPQCLNVDYPPHGIKEIGKQRLIKKLEENLYEKDIMKDSDSVESLKKAEEEKKKENFDKYSAEEKIVEETSEDEEEEDEDFNKTVTERRHQIEERLSVDRTVPASSQRVEIVQEISSIKRQSLVENKIAEVELKAGEVVDGQKTTITSNEVTISPVIEKVMVDGDRRDSELLEGVTHRLEQKMVKKIISTEDPKSPKVSKTPPPSPADFITKEQAAAIQEWDVSKKSASQEEAPLSQDAEQQGLSTTTERLVASNEETLLDKPLGQQLTGLSVIDDYLVTDLKTVCEQTNAFIQSESQPEPYDALADKYTRKEPINEKKVDDNKNNMNEKKKAKKGFFGSIKTFVERSFESDSESEKSPKKSKKPKKDKKKKPKEDTAVGEHALPPRKPKLPTPPLEPSDIDSIPFVEASVSDLPPPYKPPDIPIKEEQIPVTDLDADIEIKQVEVEKKTVVEEKEPEKLSKPITDDKDKDKPKTKEKPKEKEKKKIKGKTVIVEEVTKTIQPLVIEAEEFSIIVDPTKKESPKKSKETFTINIDESIEIKEKEILEKSPILPEEKIVKPLAALEMQPEVPIRPPRTKDHIYEDIEEPAVTIPQDRVKDITTDLIQNEINFGGWSDVPAVPAKVDKEDEPQKEIVEKHDKEVLKEKDVKEKAEEEVKKKEEKKGGFFALFKKKDSKKEEEAPPADQDEKVVEKVKKPELSEAVVQDMNDSQQFLVGEVQNYHDVRPVTSPTGEAVSAGVVAAAPVKPIKEEKVEETKVEETKLEEVKVQEPKAQSESFFGLFKKQKKEEKVPAEKKSDPTEKKPKKDDKKVDEKKVAVVLSEEVLKNILDSKRFLEGEVQNYHDVRPEKLLIEQTVEPILEVTKEPLSPKEVVDERLSTKPGKGLEPPPKKAPDGKKESSPKRTIDDSKEPSPKKAVDDKREASPKPSPGFFGLFKKSKKDEPDAAETTRVLSEQVVKEMEETDQFLVAEVDNYHDVKPLVHEKVIEKPVAEKPVVEKPVVGKPVVEKPVESVKVEAEAAEAQAQSGGFFGLFKKSKKDDEVQPPKIILSEATVKDMSDTNEFLTGEVQNYQDARSVPEKVIEEGKATESDEQPSSGFFGLFKKTKKEDEKIVPEVKKEDVELLASSVEEKVCKVIAAEEDKAAKVVEEVRESSPRPAPGFFGLFKKSKKDEEEIIPSKPPLSDSVVKDMDDSNQFLSTEVDNYNDVKPAKFEQIEITKSPVAVESSPKPSRGVFDIFKKSKKDESVESEPSVTDTVVKEIKDVEQSVKGEVAVQKEKISAETEKVTKVVEEGVESSPKSSRGLFGIFKKTKKDSEEATEPKFVISEAALQAINDTNVFLTGEVDNYHDVKPEKFEAIEEDKIVKAGEEALESSPKPSRGLFGIFKKSKKDQEEVADTKPILSESVQKEMAETDTFLSVEVEHYEDAEPIKEEKIAKVEESIESSPKPTKGLFGMFKKPKKEEEVSSGLVLSEQVVQEMEDTKQFLTGEVDNYHDVKPQIISEEEKATKVTQEDIESSPKASRGLFGIFKSPKKDKEEPSQPKIILSEETQRNIVDTDRFLTEEVEKYHDARPVVEGTVSEAPDEIKEPSPKPTTGILGMFKKTKKEEVEIVEITEPLVDTVQQVTDDTKQIVIETKQTVVSEAEKIEDVKPVKIEEVTQVVTITDGQDIEPRPEVKGGFLFKFKKTKKKPSLAETQLSEEVQKSVDDTKSFLSTEVKNYEDAKPQIPTDDKKEEKTVTFEATKSKMVLEGHLPQPEVAQVVDVIKAEVTDVVKEVHEEVKEVEDVVLQEATEVQHVIEPQDTSKKEKPAKDKKGFFHRFGKKKSQDTSFDEARGRSIEESEGSPKKQKRRKSSSPFKFFDKMKKSEEDVKEMEPSVEVKIDDVTKEEVKEDLLAVEFEEEPAMDLSKEVLGSLDKKMEALKRKYTPEVQKQMNDCRDFLFIEVDNYEDAKQLVVTDIDTGLSTDAGKTVDDIIEKAAKVVEHSKVPVDAAKSEAIASAEKITSQVEDTARKTSKKAEKKSGGFFSKLGNLISGTVDDSKSELKDAKKSAEKAADKTKQSVEKSVDSAAKSVDSGVEKMKEKTKEAQQVASDKVTETKDGAKELQEAAVQATREKIDEVAAAKDSAKDKTAQKIDDAKQDVMALKESLLEVTAKTGQKLDSLKKDIAVKAELAAGEAKEVKDSVAAKSDGVKKEVEAAVHKTKADVQKSAQEMHDMTSTKIDEIEKTKESVQSKVEDAAKTAAEETSKKFVDFREGGSELISGKVAEIEKAKVDATEAVTEKGLKMKKDLETTAEKGKETVAGALGKIVDSTTQKIEEMGKVKDATVETATKKVEAAKVETESKAQTFTDAAASKLDQIQSATDAAKTGVETKASHVLDTTGKYTQDIKSQVETTTQEAIDGVKGKADVLTKTKDKIVEDIQTSAAQKVGELVATGESAKTAAGEKIDTVSKAVTQKTEDLSKGIRDSIEQKTTEVKQAKDDAAKKVDDFGKAASQKFEDVKILKQDITDRGAKQLSDFQKTGEGLQKAAADKFDQQKEKVTEKGAAAVESLQASIHGKVGEIQETKDKAAGAIATKFDDVSKVASQKVDAFEKAKQQAVDSATDTVSRLEKTGEEVKKAVGEKVDQKREDVVQIKDDIKDASGRKLEEISKITTGKIDALAHGKKQVEDFIARETSEAIKAEQDIKKAASVKVDDVKKAATGKIDDLVQIKEAVKETGAQKVDELRKTAADKAEDVAKAKTTLETQASQAAGDFMSAASQKIGETKEKLKEDTSKKVERMDDLLTGKIDDLVQMKQSVKETGAQKVEELRKAAADKTEDVAKAKTTVETQASQAIGGFMSAASQKIGQTKGKLKGDTSKKVERMDDLLAGKIDDLVQIKESVKETGAQKVDELRKTASDKTEDVAKAKTTVETQASQAIGGFMSAASQKIDHTKEKLKEDTSKKVERMDDLLAGKIDDLVQVKESVKETGTQKVDELRKAAADKTDDVAKAKTTLESQATQAIGGFMSAASQKIDQTKEKLKEDTSKKVEGMDDLLTGKIDDLMQIKQSVKETGAQKADELRKAAADKTEDVAKAKTALETQASQAAGDFMSAASQKIGQTKEKFKEDTSKKVERMDDLLTRKIDDVVQIKESVKETGAQKLDELRKSAADKTEDVAKAKTTLETQASQAAGDFMSAASQKIGQTKEKLKEDTSKKVDDISKTKKSLEDIAAQKIDTVKDAAKSEVEYISKTASKQVDDLFQKKESMEKSLAEKSKGIVDDLSGKRDKITDESVKAKQEATDALKGFMEQKISDITTISEDASKKTSGLQEEVSQKIAGVTEDKDAAKQTAAQKVDEISRTGAAKVDEWLTKGDLFATSTAKKTEETVQKMEKPLKTVQGLPSAKLEDVAKTKDTVSGAFKQEVGDATKVKKSIVDDLTKLESAVKDTSVKIIEELSKKKKPAEAVVADVVEDKKKAAASEMMELDDQLAQLTSSLDQLSEPVIQQGEKITSYVTSPTMARRAESQRFSREERPTVREVKIMQADDESDEEKYTVTEPEEAQEKKRKPLFHLESEEDDPVELAKMKDRRDSVRSNVLETLTENKLDNLLSDLESQLVKDLERSVTEGSEKTEEKEKAGSTLSKAESELEEIKKDSQADVEQIEQKLRDLDKALDSLEQASDPKLEKKLHRVERKFERMASEVMDKDGAGVSPTEVEAHREHEFQKLVSQLSTEEVSDFQKEYSHLWDETTFSKSDDWDSKTPDSQVDVQELPQETTCAPTLTEEIKTIPQPKPRFAKETPPLQFKEGRQPKLEKQISPVRDDLLDEEEPAVPETYSDKKKFWENVTKDKRMSLHEGPTPEKDLVKKRVSVHEVPIPKPRSQVQVTPSIEEAAPSKIDEEPETKIMSEYQASFQPPSERKSKSPPKVESDKESTDSESDNLAHSGTNENAGYISDSGDVEHYISDSEIEDRVPQIRERQMSVFAPPVAAARKTIYERSASLPTEDMYEVSARSIKLRKQYYEEQIKKEMIEEQLTSEIEEEPSPERKTLIGSLVQQISEEKVPVLDIARSFDEATKKEVSFEDHRQAHKPEKTITHIEDETPISQQFQETHKEIDVDAQTKRSSLGSEQSSSSDIDRVTRNGSTSKPDSMEVHVDKSEIEDSEKLADLDQDATDLETKSLDSLNAVEMSPKSATFVDDSIPEITVTLSGKQRRISEESDEYAPKSDKKTELDSPIHVPEEHVEDTVWEVSVQSQPEAHFDEKVTSFDGAPVEKIDEDLSLSTRDESDLGSEIHQDHSDSYASDKIKSESHSDIERIIMDSLQHQKVDPIEAKAIASALIEEIEAEIQRRECLPPATTTGEVSDYLKYLAETKGLDEREVELVESVLARRQRELAKLSRGDTQASSIEITDEDLKYSGTEGDTTHVLEQQISQLKAEKLDDIKSMTLLDKIDEKHTEETHLSKDYETVEGGITTGLKSEVHTKTFESIKGEKSEAKDIIFEEDETISESVGQESEQLETRVEAVTSEMLHKKVKDIEVDEYRETSVDVSKEKTTDITTKTVETEGEDVHKRKIEDATHERDITKSIIKHHVDMTEKSPTDEVKLKGEITCEDYLSKEDTIKKEVTSETKQVDGVAVEKEEALEKSRTTTIQKEVIDQETEVRTLKDEDSVVKESKISSKVTSTDVIRELSTVTEIKEKIEVIDIDPSLLPVELDEVKTVIEKHEEIKRTSSSESKSSVESGKSPEDQFSTCSSGRKGDSDSSKVLEKPEVLMRKTSTLQKADRKSGIDFEAYSSSGESHYHSFELDSGKSRPCSSDVEGLVAAGSSEYESALTSQDYSSRSHITSTEYHTAVSSLSSKESMKSLDSESSGHLGSVEVSELSETLVPSASDAEGDILDAVDQLDDGPWNEEIMDEPADTQTKMKRSYEMTFQPEPKILAAESPQADEMDRKFTSMDDGSIVSMSLSSTSGTTEPRTVIELSRADSERMDGGSMSVSGISDQLSIEGSCDSLVFHPTAPLGTTETGTSTGQIEGNLQIESITFTTSIVHESGIRSVSTQVTSESHTPEEDRAIKTEEPLMNGKCPPETKKKTHRRQESTSSFVPPVLSSFDQKFHSDLTESDKYTAELSFKEVISDEKKDIDEREREESYETEADQGFHRDIREGKYHETEEEIKDDTPEFSSETQASVGELEQEYTSALARAQEAKKKSETPDLHLHKEQLEKRDSHGKSSSTSSEKSSFEEAEAEAAFNMVAHVSPAHKIKQICPILEDEDAEKHELETRERAQKEYEKRRSQLRDQSPGSIPDIKVTQHMTPLVDRNFRYPDLELEEQERAKEKEKEAETQKSTPQTPSSKSSEDTDQGREYVLEDSGISIPEEAATESKSTVIEQTVKEEADKDTDSPNSDSFEMLEKPDLIDDFVVIEEVAKEAQEFDSEGKSVSIHQKSKQKQRAKKHDEEVEAYLTRSAPTPLTRMTDVKFYPDGSSSDELGFEFEDSPPINNEAAASSYEKELEANKKWIEQQFQGDQAARLAAGYDYEMEFERGPLEDIKEEDINDFDPTSSRIGSVGSQKESGGSLGSVKDSYSSTPEYDVLAGRKYFTRSGEHDDISMSSLQEFENLERAMSLENRRYHQGSQDSSSNGSFKTRYYASKSGQGDDVSVSSLKEFEGLEMACIAAHKIETKAKEEEAMLAQIDEGQESIASESESCETVSRTDKKIIPDSDEEDYEKRMFEIDEIIRQAQSNVERFIDLKEADKTESLGRGDSIEEVAKVPDLDLDAPIVRTTVKVQWKENEDVMVTSTDSIDGKEEKESQHDSTDSLDQKTCADIMTASTDSIEFQAKKSEPEPINLLSDSIEIKDDKDEACGMISSDSLELATRQSETMLESTDSLADPTSSTATHATYQYETDSVFSGSFTSGGSNTMVSSTDTIDPVQVDIAAAARKVWFEEETGTSRKFSTEYIQDSGKPYVTEVIEPSDDDGFSHTIHRRVELPPEVRKVTFYGSDADERLKQFIEDFNEGEHVEEVQEVDAAGNVHTRRVVQKRFIIRGEEGPDMEEFIKKTVASKTNELTSIPKETTGEESSLAATGGPQDSASKAHASRRRQLRYEISVDDQIEVDPREHDWRFNLPKHAEGEESTASGPQEDTTSSQQRPVADQHQLSEEMKQLLKELEKESKQ